MKILDHQPQHWFLAEENGALFLDAHCDHSFVGYSFMIELSPLEVAEYNENGRDYLSLLADRIHDSVPILESSQSIYKGRDVSRQFSEKLLVAIEDWHKSNAQK